MGQEIALPDWAKKGSAQAFAVLNPADDNLSEGIGQSYAVIGYKGKVWSLRHRGEKHNFIRPDDGTPASYLDVIILATAKQKSKSFYKKYEPGSSDGERPICSSIDGLVPDPDATTKQADTCALFPRNVWKADPATGKKGRECTDYKRLAVLILPTQTKPILGQPLLEAAFLRVPPASLNSLAIMGDTMAAQGFHYSSYITRITFDLAKAHPEMQFRPLQGLTDQEAPVILKMREDLTVDRIINGGFADAGIRTIPPQEGATLLPPGQNSTGIVLDDPPQQPSTGAVAGQGTGSITQPGTNSSTTATQATQEPVSSGLASVQPATGTGVTPLQQAVQHVVSSPTSPGPSPSGLTTGLADINSGGAMAALTQPAPPPQGDTGLPEASDTDLDARIACLIKSK